jgi:4-hydroxy-4-methyl-2-oxoglutarate aldolase
MPWASLHGNDDNSINCRMAKRSRHHGRAMAMTSEANPFRGIVVTNFDRADHAVIDGLAEAGTATVSEAMSRTGVMESAIRPVVPGVRIAGSAVTALCQPGDNLMIHVALEHCAPGDVLVVAVTSPCTDGYFGDLLAESCRARGVRGLVIDAGVRDVAALRSMGFGAWSRHVSPQGTVKSTAGSVNVAVVVGGQLVNPGDVIVADDDGVVVVARSRAELALAGSQQRIAKEAVLRSQLASGELSIDVLGLRGLITDLGIGLVPSFER